ncbi:MAG: hypothetical protein V1663_01500 [archaeon]
MSSIVNKPKNFPEIITLCGSTRFKEEYLDVMKKLTLKGKIVLTVGFWNHADNENITIEQKKNVDELHLRKIDLSDSIYVINVKGYIGQSTRNEIDYALKTGKKIYYHETIK